ncbi:MAG TPA: hypothetical protein VEJ84_07545, partial [Acidimicrobiales bacterium]|nr:hypothetical protein [Acidimicrobiales bacterium]
MPTAEKKVPGAGDIIFHGVLDDHRHGEGKPLVQFEDEVIIKLALPGSGITSARDHVFGVQRDRAGTELGEGVAEDLILAGGRIVGDKV